MDCGYLVSTSNSWENVLGLKVLTRLENLLPFSGEVLPPLPERNKYCLILSGWVLPPPLLSAFYRALRSVDFESMEVIAWFLNILTCLWTTRIGDASSFRSSYSWLEFLVLCYSSTHVKSSAANEAVWYVLKRLAAYVSFFLIEASDLVWWEALAMIPVCYNPSISLWIDWIDA